MPFQVRGQCYLFVGTVYVVLVANTSRLVTVACKNRNKRQRQWQCARERVTVKILTGKPGWEESGGQICRRVLTVNTKRYTVRPLCGHTDPDRTYIRYDWRTAVRGWHHAAAAEGGTVPGQSAGSPPPRIGAGMGRGRVAPGPPGRRRPRGPADGGGDGGRRAAVRRVVRVAVDARGVRGPIPRVRSVLRREMVPDRRPGMVSTVLPEHALDGLLAGSGRVPGWRRGDPPGRVVVHPVRAAKEQQASRRAAAAARRVCRPRRRDRRRGRSAKGSPRGVPPPPTTAGRTWW
jgi:hypothetical protein